MTMRAIGREISHSSSANTGHTTNRMPLGNRSAGRLLIGENESLSRGCIICPVRPLRRSLRRMLATRASFASREHPPQRRDQPLEFDRFGVELVASGAKRLLALAGERVRGERNDRDAARLWIVLQSSRRLSAVDYRHFEIHQDDVGALAQRHRAALFAVRRRYNLEIAQELEPHLEHVDVVLVVLDVEYFGHDAASIPLSRAPASPACGLMSSLEAFAGAPTRPGRRTVKTEPLPGSLATVTSPPIMRASLRVIARPRPVPPYRCAVDESACVNSANSLACCSAVMPMPVSATANSIQVRPSTTLRTFSLTSPCVVNLQALLNRLSRICRSRMGSTVSAPSFSSASTTRRFLFCSASWRAVPTTSSISGAKFTASRLSSSLPASIFERSSTWLMRPRRWVPARCTRRSGSAAFSVPKRAALVTIISVKPMIALSGVRSSWLMLATNCDLCWLASSSWRPFSSTSVNRLAFWIASTDCAANVCRRSIVLLENSPGCRRRTTSAPTTSSAPMSGTTSRDRYPARSMISCAGKGGSSRRSATCTGSRWSVASRTAAEMPTW